MSAKPFRRVWLALSMATAIPLAHAEGEGINGFPNWSERVLLEWMNRARSDPAADLAGCSSANCGEKACYAPTPPRYLDAALSHAARFHASHMGINNYFDHSSHCTLVANVASLYPQACSGAAACSCTQGALTTDSSTWTEPFARIAQFGAQGSGEIIAEGFATPDATFYGWLYETSASTTCGFGAGNGHRYLLLSSLGDALAGAGFVSASGADYPTYSNMDFGVGTAGTWKIPSGSHFPQQAASVDLWANWYAADGPSAARVNIDGVCSTMVLSRGSSTNGAWKHTATNVASGCHRYNFSFTDGTGHTVLYPTNGSLAIGNGGATCPDWSAAAPPACPGADLIFANGFDF